MYENCDDCFYLSPIISLKNYFLYSEKEQKEAFASVENAQSDCVQTFRQILYTSTLHKLLIDR